MNELDRRRFLQSASLAVAGGYADFVFGKTPSPAPIFLERPTFEPTALFLTWQRDPTRTMTIQWIGSEADGKKRPVWYAKKGTQQWHNQGYSPRRFPLTDQWILRSELTGLEQDTEYVFRIGTDSKEQTFRTAPAKDTNPIQFVSGGDCGVGEHPRHTNKLAAAQAPLFALLGGDLAYENGKDPDRFLEFLNNYSHDVRDGQRLVPMIACIGNHDVNGKVRTTARKRSIFLRHVRWPFPRYWLRRVGILANTCRSCSSIRITRRRLASPNDWLDERQKREMPNVSTQLCRYPPSTF